MRELQALVQAGLSKSDAPSAEESARHLFVLKPAESVSFPFRAVGVRAIDGKFRVRAGYGIGEAFATKHDTWVGRVTAAVVVPVAETKRHVTEDEKKLQGTWRVTRLEIDGNTFGPGSEEIKDARVIIERTSLRKWTRGGASDDLARNLLAKPKTILFKLSPSTGMPGIYEHGHGDNLRLCIVRDDEAAASRQPTSRRARKQSLGLLLEARVKQAGLLLLAAVFVEDGDTDDEAHVSQGTTMSEATAAARQPAAGRPRPFTRTRPRTRPSRLSGGWEVESYATTRTPPTLS